MGKVSTLANEQLNPINADLLEVSHETAPGSGVWGSFKMTLATLKAWVLLTVYGLKITKQGVVIGESEYVEYIYQMERYEVVDQLILKNAAPGVIFYVTDFEDTVLYDSSDTGGGNIFNLGIYAENHWPRIEY